MELAAKHNHFTGPPFRFLPFFKEHKIILGVLALLVIICYINGIASDFVSDDKGIVINAHSFEFVTSNPTTMLRPLLNFIAYHIVGLEPYIFRSLNIIFHIGVVWLVYILAILLINERVAIFAAILFAVHPLLVESITWISGGVYVQYTFFLILSLILYILAKRGQKTLAGSIIAFILALLSSEKAIVFFPILFLYEIAFGNVKKSWKTLMPFFLISIVYTGLYFSKIGSRFVGLQEELYQDPGTDNPLIQIPVAISSYFQLIAFPKDLTLYHSELNFSMVEYIVRVIFFIGYVAAIIVSYMKNRLIFFGLSFLTIALLPMLTPFRITWVVAERYVYLGSIGVFLVIAYLLAKLLQKQQFRIPVYTIFFLLTLVLMARTIARNVDWHNEDNLWVATAKTSPSSPNTHNNLGDVYGRHGDHEGAAKEFQTAIAIKPNYADAYHNLGNAYINLQKPEDALKSYQKAAEINPRLWQSYQNIAALYFNAGQTDLAIQNMQKAIEINPLEPNLRVGMGIIYLKSGDKIKAKEFFMQALQLDPKNQNAQAGMIEAEKD